jgi:hypothetical protein
MSPNIPMKMANSCVRFEYGLLFWKMACTRAAQAAHFFAFYTTKPMEKERKPLGQKSEMNR